MKDILAVAEVKKSFVYKLPYFDATINLFDMINAITATINYNIEQGRLDKPPVAMVEMYVKLGRAKQFIDKEVKK